MAGGLFILLLLWGIGYLFSRDMDEMFERHKQQAEAERVAINKKYDEEIRRINAYYDRMLEGLR